jgi:hypothetical protein
MDISKRVSHRSFTFQSVLDQIKSAGLILLIMLVAACSKATETPSPTDVVAPTDTAEVPVPTETEEVSPPEGWEVFTNEVYGYRFFYPAEATVTHVGPQGVSAFEVPEGLTPEEYIAQLQVLLGDKLCVLVEYQLGHIQISAPPNEGLRYTICGLTGLGVGEVTQKTEQVLVGETAYIFEGFEWVGDDDSGGSHFEMLQHQLEDGTRIEFGSSADTDASYEEYLQTTRDTLLQILASFDFSVPGTFDWESYQPPPTVEASSEGDVLIFVDDITIPDGSIMEPGEVFTKTWRVQNGGENTWTTGYALLFHEGERMGGPYEVPLETEVLPNETVDLSVELTAPEEPGMYVGYWIMRNPNGVLMGTGPDKDQPFFVMIEVLGGATGTDEPPDIGAGSTVTSASLSASPSSHSGECPVTISLPGTINSEGAGSYVYQLEAGSSTPGFAFSLPPAQKATFTTGGSHQLNVSYTLEITDSVEAWARLYISAPNIYRSSQVQFSVSCD